MKKPNEMYDKLIGMHEVNKLIHIITLKNQLRDVKMNKGETIQAYFIMISNVKDQLFPIGEIIPNRELVLVTIGGIHMFWETFIKTIRKKWNLPTNELLGKFTQAKSRMISGGRIPKHEEEEPTTFSTQAKKTK